MNILTNIDIDAGMTHNLAVDINGRVYSWESNQYGECGVETVSDKEGILPTLIEDLKDYKVDTIRCGPYHSYVRTECGKHYLFGKNDFNECLQMNYNCNKVTRPYRIDQIIHDKCKGTLIDVHLGLVSTKFIVSVST